MRTDQGGFFVFIFVVDVRSVGVEAALLHHRLHQRLLLDDIEVETFENFVKQRLLRWSEAGGIAANHAGVVGIADFLVE